MKLVQTIEAELNDQSVCWNYCVWVVAGFGLGGSCLYGALFLLEAHKQLKIVAYECDPSTFEGASGILRKLEEQFPHIRGRIELKQENVAVLLLKDRPGWVADVENKKGRVILTAYNQAYGDSVVILAAVASVYKAIFVGSTNDKVQHFTGKTMVDGKMSKFGTKQWFVFHEKKFSAEKALSLLEKMQKDRKKYHAVTRDCFKVFLRCKLLNLQNMVTYAEFAKWKQRGTRSNGKQQPQLTSSHGVTGLEVLQRLLLARYKVAGDGSCWIY